MSVSFGEVQESKYGAFPQEEWNNGFLEAKRLLQCAWDDRYSLLNELAWEIYPYNTTTVAWPYYAQVECVGPLAGSGPIADYEHALCLVKYTNKLQVDNNTGLLVSEELHPYSMQLPLDPGLFCWTSKTGTPVMPGEAPSFNIRSSQYTVTYYRCASVPAYSDTYANCTNSNTVATYTLGRSWTAGKLLFGGTTAQTDTYLGSTPKVRVSYRFLIHPSNWNKFWRASTGSWETLYLANAAGTGEYTPYTSADFGYLVPSVT